MTHGVPFGQYLRDPIDRYTCLCVIAIPSSIHSHHDTHLLNPQYKNQS
jgi:hypothetical protein